MDFSNLQNGQVPKYNSDTQKWENADESGGSSTLAGLSDVVLSSLSDGQILQWDATTEKFVNKGKVNQNSLVTQQDSNSGDRLTSKYIGRASSSGSQTFQFCRFDSTGQDLSGLIFTRRSISSCYFRVNNSYAQETSTISMLSGASGQAPSFSYNSSTHILSITLPAYAYGWFIGVISSVTLL